MTAIYSLEAIYGESELSDEEIEARLTRSLHPRPSTMLYDKFAALGVGSSHFILDIGCRDTRHTCKLVKRLGCRALGIDPVADHIRRAQQVIHSEGLEGQVQAIDGRIEDIPVANGAVDFIWCRDVLSHVPKLRVGLRECARALKPGGAMLVYQTFATDLLEPKETKQLYPSLAVVAANMDPTYFEATAQASGLSIIERDTVGSEWREAWEEDGTRTTSNQLLKIARMRRDRERLIQEIGLINYEVELANCYWGVYQMLGKLCPTIYTLRRGGAAND